MNEEKSNLDSDVILAYLKLSRAMRRCPPERKDLPFPPAVGRLLECAAANPGVSSRELCEALDLRPSSLSEILVRAENDGLLCRTVDENDRRVQRVSLTPGGSAVVADMEKVRNEDAKKKTSCLTEEEKKQFCSLCNRLSEHIEKLALELPEGLMPDHPGLHHSGPRHPGEDRPGPEGPGHPPFPPGGRFRC
jgi:DNA-binding MarR family transcriptional regulator